MRTKEEILDHADEFVKWCVHEKRDPRVNRHQLELLCDIRDQLVRIADNMEPQTRFEITHPSTKEIEERIEKITGKFIKLSPKEPNNK